MQFDEMQRLVEANAERYAKKHHLEMDRDFLALKLMEEMGEFAEAILIYDKRCRTEKCLSDEEARIHLQDELADVMNIVILLAKKLDIDLLAALETKVLEKGRAYLVQKTDEKKPATS